MKPDLEAYRLVEKDSNMSGSQILFIEMWKRIWRYQERSLAGRPMQRNIKEPKEQ